MPPDSEPRNNVAKTRGRPFEKGNPGRPRGARHKITVLAERLMSDDVEGVVQSVIAAAKDGDMAACRLIFERIVPIRKGRPVVIDLPAATDAQAVAAASAAMLSAVGAGELTPEEGEIYAKLLESRRRTIETAEHEERLAALEKALDGRKDRT